MDYSQILDCIKGGSLARRKGWNGQQQFIFLVGAANFDVRDTPLAKVFPEGTLLEHTAYLAMRTQSAHIVPWLCSQSDALAEDWEVVETIALNVSVGRMTDGKIHAGAFAPE